MGVVQKINGCHSNRSEESPLSDIEPLPPRSRHLRFQDQDLSDKRGGSPQPMSNQVLSIEPGCCFKITTHNNLI